MSKTPHFDSGDFEAENLPKTPPDSARASEEAAALIPSRSYARLVVMGAMRSWGARIGVVWVGLILIFAVFAPFIANTHPLLLKQGDAWSSPLLRFLTVSDVLLLVGMGVAILVACCRSIRLPVKVLGWLSIMGLVIPGAWFRDTLVPFFTQGAFSSLGDPLSWGVWAATAACFVLYFVALAWVLVTFFRQPLVGAWFKTTAMIVAALLMAWLMIWPVAPPLVVVYDTYRTDAQAGKVQWKLHVPLAFSPADRLRDTPGSRLLPPSLEHPMGTTNNGADLASNMIYATRIALSIGFISTGIALCIGVVVGGLMGYFSGWVDLFGMRLVEIFSAIPTFILLLTFVAAFGANLYIMMVIIGLTSWVGDAVFIRAEFLRLRKQDFVQAAIAAGLPLRSVLFRHMLPNGIAPVLVSASFGVAGAILAESTLSFLGIGLKEEASWGRLLNDALGSGGTFYWWLALYPGLAIFITVFAYNLVGEALRDAIDPHLQKAAQI